MRSAGFACVAALAACYAPIVPSGVACPDGACPSGQQCIGGFCDGEPGDGGVIDALEVDGGNPASGGWAVPTKVTELSGPSNDWGPSISFDELTLYLNTEGPTPGEYTIYVVTRPSTTAGWGTLAPVEGLDLPSNEYHADISRDDRELVFASDMVPAGLRKAARAGLGWFGPTPLFLDGKDSPSLFASDLRMVVSTSNMIQEYARSTPISGWSFQRNHSNLDNHRLPGISADGLEIYVIQTGRLYRATRTSVDQPFGAPAIVSFGDPFDGYELFDPELSADGRTMYVSVDSGTSSDADIYVTTR